MSALCLAGVNLMNTIEIVNFEYLISISYLISILIIYQLNLYWCKNSQQHIIWNKKNWNTVSYIKCDTFTIYKLKNWYEINMTIIYK